MNFERKGLDRVCQTVEVPDTADDEYIEYATKEIKRNLADKAITLATDYGGIAISEPKIITQDLRYSHTYVCKEIRGEVWYRRFVYCESCVWFKRDGCYNGGYCLKMNEVAHITDGCTFGERREDDER